MTCRLSASLTIFVIFSFSWIALVLSQSSPLAFLLDDQLNNNKLGINNNYDDNNYNKKDHWNSSFRGIHSTIKARMFEHPTALGAPTADGDELPFANYRRLMDSKTMKRQHDPEANGAGGGGSFDGFVRLDGEERVDGSSRNIRPQQRHRDPADYVRSTRGGFVPTGGPYPNQPGGPYPNQLGPNSGFSSSASYPTPYRPQGGGEGNGYVGAGGYGRVTNSGRFLPPPEYGDGCPMTGPRDGCPTSGCGVCGCGCPTTAPLLPQLPPPQPLLPPLLPPSAPLFPPPLACTCPPARVCPPMPVCTPPTVCSPPPLPLPCPKPLPPMPCLCPPTTPLFPPPSPLLPPPMPQPQCPSAYIPQNDCCCNCQRPCRNIRLRRYSPSYGEKSRRPPAVDPKCNSEQLQQIIAENISEDLEAAKRRIQTVAEREMRRAFNTICGASEFSFIVHAKLYCQASVGNTTCYAFSFM